jgi:transcriptional regulator with XRE-family HTH domain
VADRLKVSLPMDAVKCEACAGKGYRLRGNGKKLRKIRLKARVSQAALGRYAGCARSIISDVETGRRSATDRILRAYAAADAGLVLKSEIKLDARGERSCVGGFRGSKQVIEEETP